MITFSPGRLKSRCISIFFLCLLLSCKYEDGPLISLRSADSRIVGNYTAVLYQIDQTDALSLWNDSVCDGIFCLGHDTEPADNSWFSTRVGNLFLSGNYTLTDRNRKLVLNAREENPGYPGNGPFREGIISTWEVLRCTNRQLWLKTVFEGHEYRVELQQNE